MDIVAFLSCFHTNVAIRFAAGGPAVFSLDLPWYRVYKHAMAVKSTFLSVNSTFHTFIDWYIKHKDIVCDSFPHKAQGSMTHFTVSTLALLSFAQLLHASELQLLRMQPDPYGYPRPTADAKHVPVGTSLFLQIGFAEKNPADKVLPETVSVSLQSPRTESVTMLAAGEEFAAGYSGKITPSRKPKSALAVYIDGESELLPGTTYTVSIEARSRDGATLRGPKASWRFTTAESEELRSVDFTLDLTQKPVVWHGGFFTGFCKPSFCTSASNRISGYELMREVRMQSPRAWSLQRDFSPTSTGHQPEFLNWSHPNVVRERETRRITAMLPTDNGILLQVEDFFGHEQYGIESDRPLSNDYKPGDEVLIADGVNDGRTKVSNIVEDSAEGRSLIVTPFDTPKDGWKIEYSRPLPTEQDPNAPGWFPYGGCYLRKFRPVGTPHFYWGRIDKEWDIACQGFDRRLVVNFTDAPGDLALDGRQWTYPKDYVQYHEVIRAYTSHLIERYGDKCLDFVWSVFNEPDLATAFWRSRDWNELQRFYDYTTDAILRSFEDYGYDSNHVFIGGLEIGAIFKTHIEKPILKTFLGHCSPKAKCEGELEDNAAFNDKRLEGKRSKRVETLCRANDGKGSPCDFISVHTYNSSPVAAAKLLKAKELALEVDPDYFADVWINSFESCPNWAPPPDLAAADSYLGNGYFSTWCADVARRQLEATVKDARYGFGETILTFWPWPNSNFGGHNNATQVIAVDDNGDGEKDRDEIMALPILHFLGLMSQMQGDFWVLPERVVDDHIISGFTSRQDDSVYLLAYAHQQYDIQSRLKTRFNLQMDLGGFPWQEIVVREYRFDKVNNSYFHLAKSLRDKGSNQERRRPSAEQVKQILAGLTSTVRAEQLAAVRKVATFNDVPESAFLAAFELHQSTKHEDVRAAIEEAGKKIAARPRCFAAEDVARAKAMSELKVTGHSRHSVTDDTKLALPMTVDSNGAIFVVIEPAASE